MFDQVQAVSDEVSTFAIRHDGIHPSRVVTLHNGVDLQKVAAVNGTEHVRRSLGLDCASHLIATIGYIRHVKGTDLFIRAAEITCREFPRAVFLIIGEVGDRNYVKQLQGLIRTRSLGENVIFVGRSDNVFQLLKLCNVFCLLSRSEGFSNALLEAMACGVPCVATRVGGNPEAVEDGRTGFLVPSENAELAADRICLLLRHPELAREMGQAGRNIVETKFTAELMAKKLVALYDGLLDRCGNLLPSAPAA